ncbi:MAG: CPBP family intramembrane glutamic endopeptidase [Candidatus Auribacterota bacterium]|nr:CPBP family intramembrane glutamic endopeptidase [Candidatus Auribacterota bacterium]
MNCNLHLILRKIAEEKLFIAAVLLVILLLTTAAPSPEEMKEGESALTVRIEFRKIIERENLPPVLSALFRIEIIIFLTLVVSGIVLNVRGIADRNWKFFPAVKSPETRWGIWPVIKLSLYFFSTILLWQRFESGLCSVLGLVRMNVYYRLVLVNAFLQFLILTIFVIGFLSRYRYAGRLSAEAVLPLWSPGSTIIDRFRNQRSTLPELLGISREGWSGKLRQAVRGYILFFPILLILIIVSLVGIDILGLPYQPHPLVQPLLEAGDNSLLWALFVVGILLGPLAEELFFRGVLFPALKKRLNVSWSVIISALLFSSLHQTWAGFLPIFGLGILLAHSYQKTGSLLVPIFIHIIHNGLFLTFTVLVFQLTGS